MFGRVTHLRLDLCNGCTDLQLGRSFKNFFFIETFAIYRRSTTPLFTFKKKNNKIDARLLCVDWTPVILSDNVNNAWVCFNQPFLSVLDTIVPVKQIRIKQRTQTWMDSPGHQREIKHFININTINVRIILKLLSLYSS